MNGNALGRRIEREIQERAGIDVAVDEDGDAIRLSGNVDSEEDRDTAASIAVELAGGRRVENRLRVLMSVDDDVDTLGASDPRATDPVESLAAIEEGGELEPDFMRQNFTTDAIEVIEEGAEPYFPPTDPVITPSEHNNAEVLGGFGPTSMTDMTVDPSAEGARLGDEALTAAILRELREDALTTDLRIHVTVREGVAYLRGTVEGIEDADAAEEVAARVPGITEVVEELRVVEI